MDINRKSHLFQEADPSLIQKIFTEKLHTGPRLETELISGGLFNTAYKASCGGQEYVIRFGPVNQHLLMGFEKNLMEAEAYVYGLCRKHQITCPRVLACDTSHSLTDRDYMIEEYISGTVMLDAGLLPEQKETLFEAMGEYAAKLHAVTNDRFGFVSRILKENQAYTWAQCLIREAGEILDALVRGRHLDGEAAGRILRVFTDNRSLLDEIRTPHLLHTDLWEGNVIIAFEGGKPYLKTVIDADRAVFGDEDFEWAAPWMDMPGIRRGAGIREETFLKPDRQMRRQIYRVFYALIGCYAGIYEYEDMDMYQSGKKEAVQAAGLALHDAGTE